MSDHRRRDGHFAVLEARLLGCQVDAAGCEEPQLGKRSALAVLTKQDRCQAGYAILKPSKAGEAIAVSESLDAPVSLSSGANGEVEGSVADGLSCLHPASTSVRAPHGGPRGDISSGSSTPLLFFLHNLSPTQRSQSIPHAMPAIITPTPALLTAATASASANLPPHPVNVALILKIVIPLAVLAILGVVGLIVWLCRTSDYDESAPTNLRSESAMRGGGRAALWSGG